MAVLVGAFSLLARESLPPNLYSSLSRALSLSAWDSIDFHRSDTLCLLKKHEPGKGTGFTRFPDGSMVVSVGYLLPDFGNENIESEAAFLLSAVRSPDAEKLKAVRGDFASVCWDAPAQRLHLITDKLGVRPLFFFADSQKVIFATTLNLLEKIDAVQKVMNFRAVTEQAVFGLPLGDRTPYHDIHVLRSGERIEADSHGLRRSFYWRWDSLPLFKGTQEEWITGAHAAFKSAIRLRVGEDREVFALLSGGLDSRMVVTALREDDVKVHSFNFSPSGTQDQVYGAAFGQAVGANHRTITLAEGSVPNQPLQLSQALRSGDIKLNEPIAHPHWLFGGSGGSTAFGGVAFSEKLFETFRAGKTREGFELYLRNMNLKVLKRLYSAEAFGHIENILVDSMTEQFNDLKSEDPARNFILVLMLNDQRRHFHRPMEAVDAHGVQFHAPFFDSFFLEYILSFPADWCLYHQLYHAWMEKFDPVARSVPWQVYPGHLPCPVKPEKEIPTQWAQSGLYRLKDKRQLQQAARTILKSKPSPTFLNLNYLRYISLRFRLGADVSYAIEAARFYFDIWLKSDKKHVWK